MELRGILRDIWFTPYCRSARNKSKKKLQCAAGSSGFEHVFIGEQKRTSISGVHGWISFAMAEQRGEIDYFGHLTTVDLGNKVNIVFRVFFLLSLIQINGTF